MKKNSILLFALFFCSIRALMAQFNEKPYNGIPSNVTVFAKDGDKFWLILNGEKQNEKAAANVKITGLTSRIYKAKIIFENAKLPSVDSDLYARDIDNNAINVVYEVKSKEIKKKKTKSTIMVMQEIHHEVIAGQTTSTTQTTTTQPGQNGGTQYSDTQHHSTTTTQTDDFEMPAIPQVTMSIKVPEMDGIGGSINVSGGNIEQNFDINTGNTSVSSSVTTTTTTKTNNNGVVKETYSSNTTTGKKPVTHAAPKPMNTTRPVNSGPTTNQVQPASPSETVVSKPAGCQTPMNATAFQTQLSVIKKQTFSDTKIKTAKSAISKNCLSTAQLKTILRDFTYESDKVEMAKFAYPYTVDKENFLTVTELFTYSSSTDELTDFLDGQ